LAPSFELVLFTASTKEYADEIVDRLDTTGLISARLYRYHVTALKTGFFKDLSKLGRPLARTILVDNLPSNFSQQPLNGIQVSTWTGGPDHELPRLCEFLLAIKDEPDVRTVLDRWARYF
jgi:Dullard-like phosphatase family protein